MEKTRKPGELAWIHNDMTRVTMGAPDGANHWLVPSKLTMQNCTQSTVERIRSWAMINPVPDPSRCFCITHCFYGPAGARICPKEQECPQQCPGHGTPIHDTVILLRGQTKEEALLSLMNSHHPHKVAHMMPESSMFDTPESVRPAQHQRHVFETVSPHQENHCICCHAHHAMMWMKCQCGAYACSSCVLDATTGYLHGMKFN